MSYLFSLLICLIGSFFGFLKVGIFFSKIINTNLIFIFYLYIWYIWNICKSQIIVCYLIIPIVSTFKQSEIVFELFHKVLFWIIVICQF